MNWYTKHAGRTPFSDIPSKGTIVYVDNKFGQGIATGFIKNIRNRKFIQVHFSYKTINKPRDDGTFAEYSLWVPLDACSSMPIIR